MSIGIALVTAGALHFIDKAFGGLQSIDGIAGRTRDIGGNIKLDATKNIAYTIKSTSDKIQSAMQTAMFQSATIVTTAALYDLNRKVVNQEDVERQAYDIGQEIDREQESNLKKIYSSDKKSQELFDAIAAINKDALNNFNSNATQFISGVAANIASYVTTGLPGASSFGGMFDTASDLGRAALRQMKALPIIKQKTIEAIKDIAAKISPKLDLLKARITKVFAAEAEQVLKLLNPYRKPSLQFPS